MVEDDVQVVNKISCIRMVNPDNLRAAILKTMKYLLDRIEKEIHLLKFLFSSIHFIIGCLPIIKKKYA